MVAGNSYDELTLDGGSIAASELESRLLPLRALSKGGLRAVYTSSGAGLVASWRAVGARAVLSHAGDSSLPPFFFPAFIKRWGEGDSLTRAAAKAGAFSRGLTASFASYVSESTLLANNGLLAAAPVFEGQDVDVRGRSEPRPWQLAPVEWPERPARPERFAHTSLEEGLLRVGARMLTNELELKPELIPNLVTLADRFGGPVFTTLQSLFEGRDENELYLPGADVKVILGKIIPDLDQYMQEIVDRLETILITRKDGKMLVDVWLTPEDGVTFKLRDEKTAKTGQPYAVSLARHTHFEVSMQRDSATLDRIQGFTAMVKLPIVPDGVTPKKVVLDTSREKLTISASAIKGLVNVVGTADVRARKFTGVDWLATMMKNAPLLLGVLLFF
ncbi:MAG: hypothetical protein HY075_00065 [Deltaproteobacteria bacterium]|nr:hypothetical protein [Deltaproteobacteria bacterium]